MLQVWVEMSAQMTAAEVDWRDLFRAAREGDEDTIANALNGLDPGSCREVVNIKDARGQTLLHLATAEGHLDMVELLVEKGAYLYLGDRQGNTAFHLAAVQNHLSCLTYLLDTADRWAKEICSNDLVLSGCSTFQQLCAEIFATLPKTRLSDGETLRFEKVWFEDATEQMRRYIDEAIAYKAAPWNKDIVQYVLRTLDPRPESGILVNNPHYNPSDLNTLQIFIPTIDNVGDLEKMLRQCFRLSALDVRNSHLQRTVLHAACDANVVDSHQELILRLVHHHGCNTLLKDRNGKSPMDLLIQDKKLLMAAPSSSRLYEELLISKRDIYFDGKSEKSSASLFVELDMKRENVLLQCLNESRKESPDKWMAQRNAAVVLQSYREWTKFEDPETRNIFYGHFVCDEVDGFRFDSFTWDENPVGGEEMLLRDAWMYYLSNHCVLERQVGRWDMLTSKLLDVTVYIHLDTLRVQFQPPDEMSWSTLSSGASITTLLGLFQEWTEMKDAYQNTFFYNALMNIFVWNRPPDAVCIPLKEQLCRTIYVL